MDLIAAAQIHNLDIESTEYAEEDGFPQNLSDMNDIRGAIVACLREQCWFKLTAKDFFIHFGYDYHLYVGSALPTENVERISSKHGLYCELLLSPYTD